MEERSRKPSRNAVQNSQQERFRKPGSSSSGNPAEKQSRNPSNQKTPPKDIQKQQSERGDSIAVAETGIKLLRQAGFEEVTAHKLATIATTDQIVQQITWLPLRNPGQNRLGMLRRAIEQNWSQPDRPEAIKEILRKQRERDRVQAADLETEDEHITIAKQNRARHRTELKLLWEGLSVEEQLRIETAALEYQQGTVLKNLFRTNPSQRLRECLAELDRQRRPNPKESAGNSPR